MNRTLAQKAADYLNTLCVKAGNRSVGSPGNVEATVFFEQTAASSGWNVEKNELSVMDWDCGKTSVLSGNENFTAEASPYSPGCSVEAELVCISGVQELEHSVLNNRIVLLYGDIAREQIMPKNFVFYNPENHRKIISLLEEKNPAAIICATGHNPSLAGGSYPFPMIEDGDFNIPSVYMTDKEGERMLPFAGKILKITSTAERRPSKAYNVTAFKGGSGLKRIVVTAHIDAKKGTPGAIDNATGVVILLLIAGLLRDYDGGYRIELAAFNGEDYYAVPGQMDFIRINEGRFGDIVLNVNIDGAGYFDGDTAFSFYGVPDYIRKTVEDVISRHNHVSEGPQWPQGDHSIFVQYGVPAIAVSSMWLSTSMESGEQNITHTERDNPDIVDYSKTAAAAEMVSEILTAISRIKIQHSSG